MHPSGGFTVLSIRPWAASAKDRNYLSAFGTRLLDAAHAALAPGGFISSITDNRDTFDHFIQTAAAHIRYRVNTVGPFTLDITQELKSFHHVKWEARGWDVFRVELYPVT